MGGQFGQKPVRQGAEAFVRLGILWRRFKGLAADGDNRPARLAPGVDLVGIAARGFVLAAVTSEGGDDGRIFGPDIAAFDLERALAHQG